MRKRKTNWLIDWRVPSRSKYKSETWYLKAFYRLNKEKLDPKLGGKKSKEKQFIETVRSEQKNKKLMKQLDTKRITAKQALEHTLRSTLFMEKGRLAQLNVRETLRTSGAEEELRKLAGIKNIQISNIEYDEDEEEFRYLIKSKKKGEEDRYIRISLDEYNDAGFKHVGLEFI